jgi:hypothetical protein
LKPISNCKDPIETPFECPRRYGLAGRDYRPLRGLEFEDVSLALAGGASFAKFDLSQECKVQALLNIMRTLFICLVLG